MRGREAVRTWIKPVMERYGEIYTAYEWHVVTGSLDGAGARVDMWRVACETIRQPDPR
jgi:hypothetical protein